jgi:hypothetical protein
MPNPNLEQLIATASLLRPMLGELVFVGGAVTSLLVTDEGAGLPRTTLDVDAIAEITSYAEYTAFGERLRALGFSEDTSEGAPLCRWMHSGTILDVMPLDEKILGFSNRWYRAAMESATTHQLAASKHLRLRRLVIHHRARSDKRPWQRWRSWRCVELRICKLQISRSGCGFESHPHRQVRISNLD